MPENLALCPECGEPLAFKLTRDKRTKEIRILLFCDGSGEDRFEFEIRTGLTDKGLARLRKGKQAL